MAVQWGDVQLGDDDNASERFILVQHNYVRREHTTTKSKKIKAGGSVPRAPKDTSSNFERNVCWKLTWKGRTTSPTNWF